MSLQTRLESLAQAIGADIKILRGSQTIPSPASFSPSVAVRQTNVVDLTAAVTVGAPVGTPINGQSLMLRFKDNGTARAITWNVAYRAVGVTLPTTTTAGKTLYVGCTWNATDSKWDVLAVGKEA